MGQPCILSLQVHTLQLMCDCHNSHGTLTYTHRTRVLVVDILQRVRLSSQIQFSFNEAISIAMFLWHCVLPQLKIMLQFTNLKFCHVESFLTSLLSAPRSLLLLLSDNKLPSPFYSSFCIVQTFYDQNVHVIEQIRRFAIREYLILYL